MLQIKYKCNGVNSTWIDIVPWPRTSTSHQCAFASAGPLLWNCLPVKTRAQILSTSFITEIYIAPLQGYYSEASCPLLLAFLSSFFFLELITLEGASD